MIEENDKLEAIQKSSLVGDFSHAVAEANSSLAELSKTFQKLKHVNVEIEAQKKLREAMGTRWHSKIAFDAPFKLKSDSRYYFKNNKISVRYDVMMEQYEFLVEIMDRNLERRGWKFTILAEKLIHEASMLAAMIDTGIYSAKTWCGMKDFEFEADNLDAFASALKSIYVKHVVNAGQNPWAKSFAHGETYHQPPSNFYATFPCLGEIVDCPATGVCPVGGPHKGTLNNLIQHLNDDTSWSREEIATWIRDLESRGKINQKAVVKVD